MPNVIDSNGRIRHFPDADEYAQRAEARASMEAYFASKYPRRVTPEMELDIVRRLSAHSDVFRELWFADRPDHRAIWDRHHPEAAK